MPSRRTVHRRYSVGKFLGSGSGGELFEAFDLEDKRLVAIKFMRSRTFESESYFGYFVEDLKREATMLTALADVPGVPDLLDEGADEDGTRFIVMSRVEGDTFQGYADKGNRPMEPETALCLVAQLSEILSGVHERGYAHRDVKPENAMIDSSGSVHLVDLGSAVELGAKGEGEIFLAGTPGYAAPEQVRFDEVCASADMFPLGCMLTEMITLRLPYPANYLLLSQNVVIPPEPAVGSLPSHLVPVVSTLLAWDPLSRPQDGRAAFDVLRPLLPVPGSPRCPKVVGPDPTARYRALLD